ncbi:MAG: hypothetical protein ACSI46_22140 [Gloeotrichia echinulata DVL01]|jgi:hypothetical protein|nr:hypothetical protein [Gloeotrichia echinulata DEX184]
MTNDNDYGRNLGSIKKIQVKLEKRVSVCFAPQGVKSETDDQAEIF